jgi:hypothetical protein
LWLETCERKCGELNAIITCTGRIIPPNNFRPEEKTEKGYEGIYFGDLIPGKDLLFIEKDTVVDYACNSYFFKTEWIKAFWSIWPRTFLSGEDIHLSATCKSKLNIDTVVLKQTDVSDNGNIKRKYGWDRHASWKKNDFIDLREDVITYHTKEIGWAPILWK